MSFVRSLLIENFRSHERALLEELPRGFVVLCGPNGAGKTNILEAVSLLSAGKGLRGASVHEIQRRCNQKEEERADGKSWVVSALVVSVGGGKNASQGSEGPSVRLGTSCDPETGKRFIKANGVALKNQNAVADYFSCVWLTPQMDRLFLESSSTRRRFLDRLVFALDPSHAGRIARYEKAMAERSRLLREGRSVEAWVSSLESQMARTGVAIAAARIDFAARLQRVCESVSLEEEFYFPQSRIFVSGAIEEKLLQRPAIEVEEDFLKSLHDTRTQDAETGGAQKGPHKSDMKVLYQQKNMPAALCSTGEQKALLIGLVLAHARLVAMESGELPVLLLDEIAAHLDENRRRALVSILRDMGVQAWMTGTDRLLFSAIGGDATLYGLEVGRILKE